MNIDLTTTYLGLPLKNPRIASASPLLCTTKGVRTHEDVLKALFAGANISMPASELLQIFAIAPAAYERASDAKAILSSGPAHVQRGASA